MLIIDSVDVVNAVRPETGKEASIHSPGGKLNFSLAKGIKESTIVT